MDNNTLTPGDVPLPPHTGTVVLVVRIFSVIYLVIACVLWMWDVFTALFTKTSWFLRRKKNVAAWRVCLMRLLVMAQTTLNIMLYTFAQVMLQPNMVSLASCTILSKFSSVTYAISVQMVLLTLIVRCGFVEGLIQTKIYRFVSFWTRLTLAVFIPLMFFSSVEFFVDGYITTAGLCLLVNTAPQAVLIVFLTGIGCMTLVMMYLFVAPIQMSIAAVNPSDAKALRATLYRNVILNSIAMAIQVTCGTLFWTFNPGKTRFGWEDGADLTLSLIFPCTECLLLGICARLMVGETYFSTRRCPSAESEDISPDPQIQMAETLDEPSTIFARDTPNALRLT